MTILALDTCFEACSVALLRPSFNDDRRCIWSFERLGRGHAERLLPMVRELVERAGVGYDEIRTIAVTVGPGSFVGTRVGVAAARAMALATGARLFGVTSLKALAHGAARELGNVVENDSPSGSPASVLITLDARRGQVYVLDPTSPCPRARFTHSRCSRRSRLRGDDRRRNGRIPSGCGARRYGIKNENSARGSPAACARRC